MKELTRSAITAARDGLPSRTKHTLARAARFLGHDEFPSIEASLAVLRQKGYRSHFALDGGAYVGRWTDMFRTIFPESKILMVEPQASKQSVLAAKVDRNTRLSDALLGPEDGAEVPFYEMETGSSVLQELTSFPRRTVIKRLTTLDRLLGQVAQDWEKPDFLKLDVQGYELNVLAGGADALANAQIVLLEVAVTPYNEGAPLLPDVLRFMWEHEFDVMDFCSQIRRADGVLNQTDLLFAARRTAETLGLR